MVEILREKASALGRAGERLEASLVRLADLRARVRTASAEQRPELVGRYREEWARAADLRFCLVVQREAIGLRRHAEVDRAYPVPPADPE